ncbi:hypothetical protein GCM10010372_84340 [Streptomyces tauricus]|nr:lasso RiPP family leader peptide-containing protein [Streptomyces tauricus]GHA72896.1 hypothetical protein GCM10010372_84340 [Streptomyces tauricus]
MEQMQIVENEAYEAYEAYETPEVVEVGEFGALTLGSNGWGMEAFFPFAA